MPDPDTHTQPGNLIDYENCGSNGLRTEKRGAKHWRLLSVNFQEMEDNGSIHVRLRPPVKPCMYAACYFGAGASDELHRLQSDLFIIVSCPSKAHVWAFPSRVSRSLGQRYRGMPTSGRLVPGQVCRDSTVGTGTGAGTVTLRLIQHMKLTMFGEDKNKAKVPRI